MDNVRIAILSACDNVCAYLDNRAPKALHYYDDELHEYLKGSANTYTFKANAKHSDSEYLVEGNKLAFRYNGRDYYFNIVQVIKNEVEVEITAYSLNFELLNEQKDAYAAANAMTFAQYMDTFDFEKVVTLGINEVSNKSIKSEWTGTDTMLARLYSLATVFDAELEFVPHLNDDYSLNKIVMNVYQAHSDTVQGVGTDRTELVLRYGKDVSGITKTSDITGLYTAIRPIGRDGLTVSSLNKTEYDADGNVEYSSPSGNRNIYAVQARDRFPSNTTANVNERYIAQVWNYDTDNVNMLYGQALAELRKNCVPQVKYEVDGYFDTGIGDTVSIADEEWNPPLYLQARVTEQIRSFTNPALNNTTFDNFKELQSQIDPSLLAAMNALIEANKTYTCTILTNNGIVFKNGEGSTTLTASVMDVGKDMTDSLTIRWSKDGTSLSTGKSITVNASDISGKAVYSYEAADAGGTVRGVYEVTVVNVVDGQTGADGKTQYLHIKYSDDGGQTFTANQGETPGKWMGYYIDFTEADSNNPDMYSWVKVEGPTGDKGDKGEKGDAGNPATAYSMLVDAYAIVKDSNGAYTPATITLTGQSQTGENPLVSYAGRFRIQETTDMSTWTTKYTSSANESTKTYTPSAGIKALSCSMYLAGGTTTLLDRQIIPIVTDGRDGEDGAPGKGITSTVITYQASSSGTTVPTGTWTTTIPSVAANQYLWTRTIITYTDNSTSTAYSIGKMGANGQSGVGITSATEKYAVSSSNTTAPTTWQDTVPTMTATNKYLWNYEITTYSDGSTQESQKRVIGVYGDTGNTGGTGADGKGISTITNYYLASASSSGVTTGTSGWTTTMQTTTTTNRYLWNYEVIKYTDNSTQTTTPVIIGTHGATGNTGAAGKGVSSTVVTYQASTSGTTVPTGTWSGSIPTVAADQYLWTRTVITYTDSTTSTSYSIGKMGANGTNGSNGADAYTVVLSNESHTFVGGTTAALAGSAVCKVIAYKGSTQVAATIGTISGMPTGMTASIQNNGTVNAQFTVTVTTAMVTKNGMLTIPITVDGKSFYKNFSFALALKGDTGPEGPQGDPMGILELATEPPTKYTGMLWKHTGTVAGLIKNATYRWNGSSWGLFKFRADNIEADSFTGYEFNGSIFKSAFEEPAPTTWDGNPYGKYIGDIRLDGSELILSYTEYTSSNGTTWSPSVNYTDKIGPGIIEKVIMNATTGTKIAGYEFTGNDLVFYPDNGIRQQMYELNRKLVLTDNLSGIEAGYDGDSAFFLDWKIVNGHTARLIVRNTGITYAYHNGTNWTTIWSK
ncbi:phage tail spike protein [Faecalicatena contorta]|uniref:Prophage endopeptidase tail n=1 Tax=Faecalicatena contorta TaxID=39482 RepID=A0A315ZVL5_9FIRM|nr:phage tail spike protein [Faecalicatena contorta]PWJ49359.1 tail protein (putative endopeptidase) [Faecalicatena contorta]SUQ14603.1 Prophage endopeptidase tail [Faecalicatena contorta]